jgi:hypothetical protein
MPHVTGTIRVESGATVTPPITVRAFDVDFRSEQLLGEALLSALGVYTITYREEQFARAEQKRADLFVRTFAESIRERITTCCPRPRTTWVP